MFAGLPLDLSGLPESPVYTVAVPQHRIVEVLSARARELGAEIRTGHEVTGLTQREDRVELQVSGPAGPYRLTARYAVGADGAHSVTRKLSGIGFTGVTYDRSVSRHAHVSVPAEWVGPDGLRVPGAGTVPPFLPRRTERGSFNWAPLPGRPPLVATVEWELGRGRRADEPGGDGGEHTEGARGGGALGGARGAGAVRAACGSPGATPGWPTGSVTGGCS